MSQLSLISDALLLVRDDQGHYLPATADQILEAARLVIDQKNPARGAVHLASAGQGLPVYQAGRLQARSLRGAVPRHTASADRIRRTARGTIDSASVYPREVVKEALRVNAAAVIFSHNHPSGNPEPSQADKVLTQRLKEALALVDVRTPDHIIVGVEATASFAEQGAALTAGGFGPPFCCVTTCRHYIICRYCVHAGAVASRMRCLSVHQGSDPTHSSPARPAWHRLA